ncbi:MAG TPA: hypothetical protein VGM51_17210 [Armatimonadota bacterium]|jgi:uncharacterized membrane protein YesL
MISWPPRPDDTPINWGDEPVEPPPPPSAGRSIRLAFSSAYDYAGSAIASSIIAFVVYYTAVAILIGAFLRLGTTHRQSGVFILGLVVLLGPIVLGPFTAGLYTLAHAMFNRDDPHVFDMWRGAVKHIRSSWALAYAQTLVTTVLVGDLYFLLTRPGVALKVIGVIVGYLLLFWLMMLVYQWPLLVEQGKPLKTTVLRSALLAAHNPFYTLAFCVVVLLMLALPLYLFVSYPAGAASLIPVSLMWSIIIASLHTSATLEILRKYPDPSE